MGLCIKQINLLNQDFVIHMCRVSEFQQKIINDE